MTAKHSMRSTLRTGLGVALVVALAFGPAAWAAEEPAPAPRPETDKPAPPLPAEAVPVPEEAPEKAQPEERAKPPRKPRAERAGKAEKPAERGKAATKKATKGRRCSKDRQCRGGEICFDGACRDAYDGVLRTLRCRKPGDCPLDWRCRGQRCAPLSDIVAEKIPCRKHQDCPAGLRCEAQVCAGTPAAGGGAVVGEMVAVPAGPFTMGFSPQDIAQLQPVCQRLNPECTEVYFTDAPLRSVTLDAFEIDRTEVTVGQFADFLNAVGDHRTVCGGRPCAALLAEKEGGRLSYEAGRYVAVPGLERHPMVNVSWFGADAYCRWAGKRLPSEAQWEKAARGTDARWYPWGNQHPTCDKALYGNDLGGVANLCVDQLAPGVGQDTTALVGSYPQDASPFGALDMAGNAQEWVADWYETEGYRLGDRNPTGPAMGDRKVRRGASWGHLPTYTLTPFRDMTTPDTMGDLIGFRCVR